MVSLLFNILKLTFQRFASRAIGTEGAVCHQPVVCALLHRVQFFSGSVSLFMHPPLLCYRPINYKKVFK